MSAVIDKLAELGIVVRLDGATEQRVSCPECGRGDRDDALGVNLETGVFHCFRCTWSGRAGDRESRPPAPRVTVPKPAPSGDTLERIWARTQPLRRSLGEIYLEYRSCAMPPSDGDLRYLPPSDRHPHPTLCALVTNAVTGERMSLHFTRLAFDGCGKAGTDCDKLFLPRHSVGGGVIRLWPDESVTHGLGLAEGIETALSAAHAYRPMWATADAGNMKKFPVLAGIESLVIFADHDTAGLDAARACGTRWAAAGHDVRLVIPEQDGEDINDVIAA